jgi:Zn-dependent M28 family amino/carboxypeptidase
MARLTMMLLAICVTMITSAQSSATDSIIDAAGCKQIVELLAADSFLGRHSGSAMAEKAAHYIAGEFKKAGCVPGISSGSFFHSFTITWDGQTRATENVIGILPGKSKPHEWVVFSAHYDHVGTKSTNIVGSFMTERGEPEKSDSIYNGANDNASGTTALIMLARYFALQNNNERTVVFMAFSGEEMGLLGSRFTSNALSNHDSIVAMINMDMLAVPISRRNKNPFITGPDLSNLQSLINKKLFEKFPATFGKKYFRDDPYKGEHLFRRSDNYSFAVHGVPAHTIIATHPRDKYYHSLNDEPWTLDYELLAKNIRALAIGAAGLADGSDTPSRINPLKIKD